MSHHLDSPIARQDIRLDITDLYVFRGETGTVFVINVCHSIFGPIPAPGYHPEGMYEFKVDLDGDAVEDLTYRLTFDERDAHGKQRYVVRRITGRGRGRSAMRPAPSSRREPPARPSPRRPVCASGRAKPATRSGSSPMCCTRSAMRFRTARPWTCPDGIQANAKNLFAGHTVYSIVLEVPDGELLAGADGNRRIGVWAVSTLATDAGGWRSINRVGLPMIHPLFTQYNEDLGNRLNAGRPADDFATYGETVTKAIAGVVSANGTAEDPRAYGEKVARRFFPNILPYEVGTPAVFGFAEWNGRSLTDNAPNVMFSTRGEYSGEPWDRQGVGHLEAVEGLSVRSRGRLSDPRLIIPPGSRPRKPSTSPCPR